MSTKCYHTNTKQTPMHPKYHPLNSFSNEEPECFEFSNSSSNTQFCKFPYSTPKPLIWVMTKLEWVDVEMTITMALESIPLDQGWERYDKPYFSAIVLLELGHGRRSSTPSTGGFPQRNNGLVFCAWGVA